MYYDCGITFMVEWNCRDHLVGLDWREFNFCNYSVQFSCRALLKYDENNGAAVFLEGRITCKLSSLTRLTFSISTLQMVSPTNKANWCIIRLLYAIQQRKSTWYSYGNLFLQLMFIEANIFIYTPVVGCVVRG